MAIKKAQANYDNGTTYDVIHYETQVGQVKVLDASGNPSSDLNEMVFSGKLLTSVDANTVKSSGKYRIKGGINLPAGLVATNTYIFNVDAVDIGSGVIVAHQELYDHINHEIHHRTINGTSIGSWVKVGKSIADQVAKIGNLSSLYTIEKGTIVDAINSLSGELEVVTDIKQEELKTKITSVETKLNSHNHDTKYLSLSGGSLTGTVAIVNNSSFSGKNTSGASLNVGKVNDVNDIVIGDTGAKTIIQAKSGDISLSDGTNKHKLYHSGNDGAGSGLDADTVDNIQGAVLARRDVGNTYTADQVVSESKSLYLKASEGSSQAGSIFFRDGSNNNKGRIMTDASGDMKLYGGNTLGLTVASSGNTETTHDHHLVARDRQVAVRFKLNDADKGAGFYMNSTSKQVGFHDWEYGGNIFTTDRDDQTVKFTNEIFIQGKRLSIQAGAPSSPKTGDIWIDI